MDNYGRVKCCDPDGIEPRCEHYNLTIKVPHRRHIVDGRYEHEVEYRQATTCRLRLGHVPDKWRRCDSFKQGRSNEIR